MLRSHQPHRSASLGALAVGLVSALPAAAQCPGGTGVTGLCGLIPCPDPYVASVTCLAGGAVVTIEMGGCWRNSCVPHSPAIVVHGDRIDVILDSTPVGSCLDTAFCWCEWAATPPLPDGVYRVFTRILPFEAVEQGPLEIRCGCYPDCDGSGALDFFDFLCFQNAFLAGDPYADCDGNNTLDFFDFLCFQNEFLAGCP